MRLNRGDIVFIDANAIGAAHAVHVWNALRNGFHLVTVLECAEEVTRPNKAGLTLTGKELESFKAELEIRPVDNIARFRLREALGTGVALDPGERDLVAAAYLETQPIWHLCGPDRATLRALKVLNRLDRMVALEELCVKVGARTAGLQPAMSIRWLSEKRTKLELGDTLI